MKLRVDQLEHQLQGTLAPVYLISGDEPLQLMEAADRIRGRARDQGYGEREVLDVDRTFDWGRLLEAAASLSLFAERRLIDLRMPAKPGDAGAKALVAYAERPPEDAVLLITCPRVDRATTARKWFQALEQAGVIVQVWPVEPRALPDWIQRRMRTCGLRPTPEAAALLADRVEGNLLAAAQEIEKLLLVQGPGRVDEAAVTASVADSARFNVFGLVDNALGGQAARTARMLWGLRAEGVAPALISWALGREVRGLAAMAWQVASGEGAERVLARHRVWERRKPLIRSALKRIPLPRWHALVRSCGHTERVVKGAERGNPWDELLQLGLQLAGAETVAQGRVGSPEV